MQINNKETLSIVYKLLHDGLLILLIFFMLALVAEGVLPGIIASHFGLYKVALLILGNILAIFGIRKIAGIYADSAIDKKIAWPLIFISALLIFNSLIKLNFILNLFILIFIFASGYFIAKVLQEE